MTQAPPYRKEYRVPTEARVNIVGPFFAIHNLTRGKRNPKVGGYEPNTNRVRVVMLLHELAHMVYDPNTNQPIFGPDGDDPYGKPSRDNTKKIQKACGNEIDALP